MKLKIAFLFTFCFVISLLACTQSQPKLNPLLKGATILAFGDSLTSGSGTIPSLSYPNQLAKLINFEVINAGVAGRTTLQGLQRLPKMLEKYNPNLVLLCLGGNDMLKHVPEEKIENNLIEMIMLIRKSGAQIVLIAVPKPSVTLQVPQFYQKIATQKNLPLLQDTIADLLKQRDYKADYIHLNAKGYKKLAEKIAELLKKTGAIPEK